MPYLALLRHGQSQWNLENRFTGWVDVAWVPGRFVEAAWLGVNGVVAFVAALGALRAGESLR